ncbi:MAG: flavodoxin [Thiohalocapsa sp.]|uniref:flavodoxin n=1 Tax=Thiohalocapsa sp. TaxID=2497641 RepID=UPI0025E14D3B|nr:flavodoxin [Thiohalocapsa sp.]MCG6943500.1 flavodoxin [Thiohalocapsa sp.]
MLVPFGTDSGTTRLIAKKIAKQIKARAGDGVATKPVNVNRASAEDLLGYRALILGTPTYGEGVLPGIANGTDEAAWLEFLPKLAGKDFTGKRIALYGLGDQETYPTHFCDAMMDLHRFFSDAGAELLGATGTEGYEFRRSRAVVDGRFVGLALDQHLQHLLTDERIDAWLDQVLPLLLEVCEAPAAEV